LLQTTCLRVPKMLKSCLSLQLRSAARPTYNWGPRLEEHRVGRYASEDNYLTAVGDGGSVATDTGLGVNTISVEKQL